jgi:hypothetical protein
MKSLLFSIGFLFVTLISCISNSQDKPQSRKEYYHAIMIQKDISLTPREDPFSPRLDSLAMNEPKVEFIWDLKGGKVVDFALKSNGHSEFMVDYTIKNKELHVTLESVNDAICLCSKLFQFRLELKKENRSFSEVIFHMKGRKKNNHDIGKE